MLYCPISAIINQKEVSIVELADIPATNTEAYINRRGKMKFRTVDTKKTVNLYYNVDGGYIAKLDWENNMIESIE